MTAHNNALLDALAANQKTTRNMLHEMDTNDVAISPEALTAMGKAARSLLARVIDAASAHAMPLSEIVSLFASRLYWNEAGGELIMCAELDGRTMCLPIPAEHWNVTVTGQLQ